MKKKRTPEDIMKDYKPEVIAAVIARAKKNGVI
jgi:hypothetical protein